MDFPLQEDFHQFYLAVNVSIGTPAQHFRLLVTGYSADLYVAGVNSTCAFCTPSASYEHHEYYDSDSDSGEVIQHSSYSTEHNSAESYSRYETSSALV